MAKSKPKVREIDLDQQRAERKSPMDYRGPTQGRIAASGGAYVIGGDTRGQQTFTMQDSPLDRLHGRRAIGDKEYFALKRYYSHWQLGGLQSTVGSVDLNRIFCSEPSTRCGMAMGENQIYHQQEYRAARKEIGHRPGIVVDNVVCCEWSLEIGGYGIGYTSPYRARQAAIEVLRDAGYRLARFWGMA